MTDHVGEATGTTRVPASARGRVSVAAPATTLSELDALEHTERLVVDLDDTAAGVHELFAAQAQETPDAVALLCDDHELTYDELNAAANRLAHHLAALGVGPDTLVGICLERGVDLVVGLLAILKAGGVYVPLDPGYPRERLSFMLEDTAARVLVTQSALLEGLPASGATMVLVDADRDAIAARPPSDPGGRATPDHLAYVIYTSGSTGAPKGVAVAHGSLAKHCMAMADRYALTPSDRMLVFGSFAFDVSLEQTLSSLIRGAGVVLRGADLWDPETLPGKLSSFGITLIDPPTAYWHQLATRREVVERLCTSTPLRLVATGGEAMASPRARTWIEASGGRLPLLNNYGPTEATITSTSYEVTEPDALRGDTVPIGRPVAGTEVHLLDPHGDPVLEGVVGEVYVGGARLARGYLNRPALTAERFVPDPFSTSRGARLYRSGDRARYLDDGNIEFLGRVDDQVKIRGFRIEPGEIEACLERHPAIDEAVVVARRDGDATVKRLVAYFTARGSSYPPGPPELRAHVLESLPDHMVPARFVSLDELPLTPNGKIDRAALPAPEGRPELEQPYVAPRTTTEEILAGVWAEALAVGRVGVHDDFFELGGNSLTATRVGWNVRSLLGAELTVAQIFGHPTVALLAAEIESRRGRDERPLLPPVEVGGREATAPLSFQQEQIRFLTKITPENVAYQTQATIRIEGPFDVEVFERAVKEIASRHEILRTTYGEVGGQGEQIVHPQPPEMVDRIDLSSVPSNERAARLDELHDVKVRKPFDLTKLPLMRWTVVRLGPEEHEIVLAEHHVVHDGFSFTLLMRELTTLYTAFVRGEESPLEDLPIQYRDYARWQRKALESDAMRAQRDAWSERLAGVSGAPELSAKPNRPPIQRFVGDTIRVDLPSGLPGMLRARCLEERVTPFVAMLAAFAAVLHRYTGETDVAVASGLANRNVEKTDSLIGMFVNPVLLRCDLAGDPSFRTLVRQVQDVVLDALRNQELPFAEVVRIVNPRRDPTRNPLLEVMFSFHDSALPKLDFAGAAGTLVETTNGSAKTDLNVTVIPGAESRPGDDDRITLFWEYNVDLFEGAAIERMTAHYSSFLAAACADPDTRLSELGMLTEPERHHVVVELNDTAVDYPLDACVHELFQARVQETPDAVALVSGDEELTYEDLNARANRLAHHLVSLGVGPDTLAGICLERGIDAIVGVLAILKAGGAYVPLDPDYPQERLAFMVEDTGAGVLVTSAELATSLPAGDAQVVLVDQDEKAIAAHPDTDPEHNTSADDLAYVIYTSGSTGVPKGVAVPHRGIVRLVMATSYIDVSPKDVFLQFAPISFDASTLEMWAPLLNGARVAIAAPEDLSPQELSDTLERHGVTTLWLTAALFNVMIETHPQGLRGVRQLLAGGEALSASHVARALEHLPDTRLVNGYGPTESTTFTCCYPIAELDPEASSVPIGRPIQNTDVYLLDPHGNPVPKGVAGELFIGGAGLARGYLNRAALTAERFVPDPFSKTPGARLYRTGDLARYLTDGNIEFLGRVDHQVKIRGFRIEPGEIEAALTNHSALQDAVVVAREDTPGDKRLVAYLVAAGEAPTTTELRAHLQGSLPDYMVPAHFVTLDELPLTPNGKLDRAALPAPEGRPELEQSYVAPRTPTEEIVAGIWSEVLGIERVGVHDDFFDLGGHSLVGNQVMSRLWSRLHVEVAVGRLFEAPTVEALAEVVDDILLEEIESLSESDAVTALTEMSLRSDDPGEGA